MPTSPARYTHGHEDSVLASHRWRSAANSAAYLLPHLTAGASVLDVGCGPGTITLDLARAVGAGQVIGIDQAESVIAPANEAAQSAGVANAAFTTGDVFNLGFEDDTFDVVHAHQVLQHLSDPITALREMRRVCRPGGLVAVRDADYAAMVWAPADPRLTRWQELYDVQARANGGEPDAGRHLLGWAQAAGFSEVTPSASVWCFATPADRDWWGGTWAERVTTTGLGRQLVEGGLATSDELAEVATGWREWAARDDGWFGVIHGEILARP